MALVVLLASKFLVRAVTTMAHRGSRGESSAHFLPLLKFSNLCKDSEVSMGKTLQHSLLAENDGLNLLYKLLSKLPADLHLKAQISVSICPS